MAIRVRFAPSPTGQLHFGSLRTALFNYLYAKKHHGTILLRLEDTDRKRFVPDAARTIEYTLSKFGIKFDESPSIGGNHAPYIQSERSHIYREHINYLISQGNAYRCFCNEERLDHLRKNRMRLNTTVMYDRHCASLSAEEVNKRLESNEPFTVRMRVPQAEIAFMDPISGREISFESSNIDDSILLKSDGCPTYHLANVIDDHLMGITHVIRGEEWINSTAKHIILYRMFGWDIPEFIHFPLLVNENRAKLSKRHGSMSVEDLLVSGYLPEAILYYAFQLGSKEPRGAPLMLHEMATEFSLKNYGRKNLAIQEVALRNINKAFMARMFTEKRSEFMAAYKTFLLSQGVKVSELDDEDLEKVCSLVKDRVSTFVELKEASSYFFQKPDFTSEKAVKTKNSLQNIPEVLSILKQCGDFTDMTSADDWSRLLHNIGAQIPNIKKVMRFIVTAYPVGPSIEHILALLGPEEVLKRINEY